MHSWNEDPAWKVQSGSKCKLIPLLEDSVKNLQEMHRKPDPVFKIVTQNCLFANFSQQEALLEDLRTDIPVHFNFLFSDSHVEVISGKQEGKWKEK